MVADKVKGAVKPKWTRKVCESLARAHVKHWQKKLGLEAWELSFRFARTDTDGALGEGRSAYSFAQPTIRHAQVVFDERLDAARYDYVACHEVLHVLWQCVDSALDKLSEPAQSVIGDEHHWALECVARALTGMEHPYRGAHGDLLPSAPWATP